MPTLQAFDGDTLEAALARVNEEVGRGARIKQAEKIRTGGVAGFFAKERYEVVVEIDESTAAPRTDAPERDAPVTAAPEPMSLLDLADEVSRLERGDDPTPPADPGLSTEGQTFQEVLRGIASEAGFFDPAVTPTPEAEPVLESVNETESDDAVATMLAALGVPAHLLGPAPDDRSVAQRVLSALERIPPATPVVARRGDVVVVVGDEHIAMEAAGLLAGQIGHTVDDVVVAGVARHGFNTLRSPDEAQRQSELWRSCGSPFVVALCAPEGAAGIGWVRSMLDALDPVTVWAAVRADRKPDDVWAWVERVGAVDALAVGACADTCSPAALLSVGVPVASLEGRRATPAAWAALLMERLSA